MSSSSLLLLFPCKCFFYLVKDSWIALTFKVSWCIKSWHLLFSPLLPQGAGVVIVSGNNHFSWVRLICKLLKSRRLEAFSSLMLQNPRDAFYTMNHPSSLVMVLSEFQRLWRIFHRVRSTRKTLSLATLWALIYHSLLVRIESVETYKIH